MTVWRSMLTMGIAVVCLSAATELAAAKCEDTDEGKERLKQVLVRNGGTAEPRPTN